MLKKQESVLVVKKAKSCYNLVGRAVFNGGRVDGLRDSQIVSNSKQLCHCYAVNLKAGAMFSNRTPKHLVHGALRIPKSDIL